MPTRPRSDPPLPRPLAGMRSWGAWHGPPPRLPDLAERAAERWYALPPRIRLAVGVLAVALVLTASGAGAARSPWGPPVEVLVAASDLPAGATLDGDHVDPATRPGGLVPADPVTAVDLVDGPVLAAAVLRGTVLSRRHLAGDGGPAAGLAPGRAAFPVEAGPLVSVTPGQRADVVAGDVDGRGRTLSRDARVIAVTDGVVWLDVAREDAPALAAAATWDGLRLVLLPP